MSDIITCNCLFFVILQNLKEIHTTYSIINRKLNLFLNINDRHFFIMFKNIYEFYIFLLLIL